MDQKIKDSDVILVKDSDQLQRTYEALLESGFRRAKRVHAHVVMNGVFPVTIYVRAGLLAKDSVVEGSYQWTIQF
jgi:hypothetical protein